MKLLVVFSLIAANQGLIFGPSQDWDGLRVTWGINPFDSFTFSPIPRTVSDAENQGWRPWSSGSAENSYCGRRYTKAEWDLGPLNTVAMPIYDKNGYIAGIQTMIPDSLGNNYPSANIIPPFIHEPSLSRYTLTAYFSPPEVVCGAGRTRPQFDAEGTGTELHFLTGNRTTTIKIPYWEADLVHTSWVKGKCFYTMGQHYFYNVTTDMPCSKFLPMFLMYNGGRINAFGFAFLAKLSSPRYEHPSFSDLGSFMAPVPGCLARHSYSSIHIYMDDSPRTNTC